MTNINSGEKLTDVYMLLCPGFKRHDIVSNDFMKDIINKDEKVLDFIKGGHESVLKIGESGKFQERSKSYQTNCPEVIFLGKIANIPKWIETSLHRILDFHKYVGFDNSTWKIKKRSEYFYYSFDIVKFFYNLKTLNSQPSGKDLVCSKVKNYEEVKNRFMTWKTPPYNILPEEGILSIMSLLLNDIKLIEPYPDLIPSLINTYRSAYIECTEELIKRKK